MNRREFLIGGAAGVASALVPSAPWLQADNGGGAVQPPAARKHGPLLPRAVILPLDVVNQYFPEVTMEASTGTDQSAVGDPAATRAVIYMSSDGEQKVTLSADLYETAGDASAAYQLAVRGSQMAPGFNLLPSPDMGAESYAGTSTNGEETHVGLGVLDGKFIVAATIAGYDAAPDNVARLIALARELHDAAAAALDAACRR